MRLGEEKQGRNAEDGEVAQSTRRIGARGGAEVARRKPLRPLRASPLRLGEEKQGRNAEDGEVAQRARRIGVRGGAELARR